MWLIIVQHATVITMTHTDNDTLYVSDTFGSEVVTITPEMAEQLLEQNTRNRNISPTNLELVKTALERGEWELNGEAIKIAKDGTILDGQHRLWACLDTEISFPTLVIYGLDAAVQETMDTGKSRSIPDLLSLRGYTNVSKVAAVGRGIVRYEKYSLKTALRTSTGTNVVTNKQVVDYIESNRDYIYELVKKASRLRGVGLPDSVTGLLMHVLGQIDREDADYFFEHLESGAGLSATDPIYVLRETLRRIKDNVSESRRDNVYRAALVIKAWNRYRMGGEMKQLRFRPGGANPEAFPEPI